MMRIDPRQDGLGTLLSVFKHSAPMRLRFGRIRGRDWSVTGGIITLVGLTVATNGTGPTPPVNPTLNRRKMGVVTFYGRCGTEARSGINLIVPIRVSIFRSHDFAFVLGAPPTSILVGGTTKVRHKSNRPHAGGINSVDHTRLHRVTRAGLPSLGTGSIRTTVGVIRKATHGVNIAITSWTVIRVQSRRYRR